MAIRIFIDQGHNPSGHNAGAEGNGLREQDVTYNVGIYLASLLNDDVRFQARVSRPTPETVLGIDNATSLQERVNMANSWPADYFISIHCNSNTNPEINGTEVYVYRANTQSYWLAQHILNGIVERVGTRDNGVRINPSLFVLRRTTMPAALGSEHCKVRSKPGCFIVWSPIGRGGGSPPKSFRSKHRAKQACNDRFAMPVSCH